MSTILIHDPNLSPSWLSRSKAFDSSNIPICFICYTPACVLFYTISHHVGFDEVFRGAHILRNV